MKTASGSEWNGSVLGGASPISIHALIDNIESSNILAYFYGLYLFLCVSVTVELCYLLPIFVMCCWSLVNNTCNYVSVIPLVVISHVGE